MACTRRSRLSDRQLRIRMVSRVSLLRTPTRQTPTAARPVRRALARDLGLPCRSDAADGRLPSRGPRLDLAELMDTPGIDPAQRFDRRWEGGRDSASWCRPVIAGRQPGAA